MPAKKQYKGDTDDFERKLARVMERLGVEKYQCDWSQSRGGSRCYVEMLYGGRVYRFENGSAKSRDAGRNLFHVSDLLASIVYTLEGIARAVEQDILTLDMLLTGVPALPPPTVPECFRALGFDAIPSGPEEVRARYKALAKVEHPDAGGSAVAFASLQRVVDAAIGYFESREGGGIESS